MRTTKNGRLVVVTGPMFSGKTSELIRLLERERFAGRKAVMFKPDIDNRYHERNVVTHKGDSHEAMPVSAGAEGAEQIGRLGKEFDAIGIDEAQFFEDGKALIRVADSLADMGKTIYLSLLNRSHTGEPFRDAPEMMARADYVYSLTAICRQCGKEATFTQRISESGKETFGELIQVGGKNSYEPRCRNCFVRPQHQAR